MNDSVLRRLIRSAIESFPIDRTQKDRLLKWLTEGKTEEKEKRDELQ